MKIDFTEKCWDAYRTDFHLSLGYKLHLHDHLTFNSAVTQLIGHPYLSLIKVDNNNRIMEIIPHQEALRISKLNQL
jgi:hypothetical protein